MQAWTRLANLALGRVCSWVLSTVASAGVCPDSVGARIVEQSTFPSLHGVTASSVPYSQPR